MTGLDKILAQIKADSDSVCADIKQKTLAQCDTIIAQAEKKAAAILSEGESKAHKAKCDIISRAESSADLDSRSVILRAKQDIIVSSLENARKYLCGLPSDEYFDLICKMISKYSENRDGYISFSKKDYDRLPSGFLKTINSCCKGTLSLQKETAEIDGGFILTYGGIEVNCSFCSLFSANNEIFCDEVSKILFA